MKAAARLGALGALLLGCAANAQSGLLVRTQAGAVQGRPDGAARAFLGIPYAQPPVGKRRWRAPVSTQPWRGVRDAARFGASCMQADPKPFGPYTGEFLAAPPFSEDCLFLNVWTPTKRAGPLPVLVWLHGGGYNSGSAAIPIYNGRALAAKGAVVVSVNYRLGIFGFLAHPGLSAESADKVSGNYGLLDQIAALRWVKENIAAFGGDPKNVTIDGQSAGAGSVNALLLSPRAKGLFERAIAQSAPGLRSRSTTLAEAEAQGIRLATLVRASTAAALRAMHAQLLVQLADRPVQPDAKTPPEPFLVPVVDGVVLPRGVGDRTARPVSPVPLMIGFNADEAAFLLPKTMTPAAFVDMVRHRYATVAERLLTLYPHEDEASAVRSARELARDRYMASLIVWAEGQRGSGQPVFAYLFDHSYPGPEAALFRAFHTAEVPYVFGALEQPGRDFTARDHAVADQVQRAWLRFMRRGDPNGAGAVPWQPLDPAKNDVFGLGDRVGPRPAVSSSERLAVFRDYVAKGGALSLF